MMTNRYFSDNRKCSECRKFIRTDEAYDWEDYDGERLYYCEKCVDVLIKLRQEDNDL